MKIFMNDAYIEESEARITPFSNGFMYGLGAFETIRVRNRQVLYIGQHHKRLMHACSVLSLKLPYSIEECESIIGELLSLNVVADGFVKIVASRGNQDRTDVIFLTGTKVYKKEYETGLKLCLAESRRNEHSKLVGIKSMNYAENIMEKERALRLGFDEAVFLNTDGMVAEGCVSNVFWAKAGIVYTPSCGCGILQGTARERTISRCAALDIPIHTGEYILDELLDADEVFVTNSLMEIMPVQLVGDRQFDIKKYEMVPLLIGTR